MNHATESKRLLTTFCVNGDEGQRARVAEMIVDHIIAAVVEAVEAKHQHSPGCDEAPAIDPDMPRRFRWLRQRRMEIWLLLPAMECFFDWPDTLRQAQAPGMD